MVAGPPNCLLSSENRNSSAALASADNASGSVMR